LFRVKAPGGSYRHVESSYGRGGGNNVEYFQFSGKGLYAVKKEIKYYIIQ
jgi:hypothetical protein